MAKRSSKRASAIPRSELSTVAFDRIHRSPLNPRTDFPAKGIEDLAATIEQEGLLEALTVRPAPDRAGHFEIAAGERRFRALELLRDRGRLPADWPVPVQVRDLADRELVTLALVENLLREDLHPLDEGFAYQRLVDEGVTTAEIARRVKRSQRHIQLRIQLTTLAPQVQRAFRAGEILLAHARVLATAPPERHLPAFETLREHPGVFADPRKLMTLLAKDSFPRDRAAFPAARYKGPKIKDPQSGVVYYLDLPQVLRLQLEAAKELREHMLSEHQLEEVEILQGEPSQVWARYREASGKPTHGVIRIGSGGEISVYERLVPASARAPDRREPEPGPSPAVETHEPGTATLHAAAQRIRNSALQEALAGASGTALRLAVVALLQKPHAPATGLAFGPLKPAPPVGPDAPFAQGLTDRLEEVLGPQVLPPPAEGGSLLDRISQPDEALSVFEALGGLPEEELTGLLAALVAARVGSPAIATDDAPLVAALARDLAVSLEPASWLRPDYLELYTNSALIRLAVESRAVAAEEAGQLEGLPKAKIIARILESDSRDESFLPPELSFRAP